jgi:hypothetical protein
LERKKMNMLTRMVVLSSALCLVFSAAGFAQGFSQGDKVLTLSGSGASDNEFIDNDFNINGSIGYFLTDGLEIALRQAFGFNDLSGDDDQWSAATRVALAYNFDIGSWWPFIGVNLGYIYGDAVSDTWVAGPEAGVRVFVNNTTFIMLSVEYEFFFNEGDDIDDAFDDGEFIYSLGIGFRW